MDRTIRDQLVDRYREGPRVVSEALEGVTEAELDACPGPDDWSARQIAHHLADSEMTAAIRLRRLIAEDEPLIAGYDEEGFAARLHYDRPIAASLAAFDAARASTAEILDGLSDAEWGREGTHSESGAYGVEAWLETYAAHAHDHAAQIRRARATARG
jgi:hypothetical protein